MDFVGGGCPPAVTLNQPAAAVGVVPGHGDRDKPSWSIISYPTQIWHSASEIVDRSQLTVWGFGTASLLGRKCANMFLFSTSPFNIFLATAQSFELPDCRHVTSGWIFLMSVRTTNGLMLTR